MIDLNNFPRILRLLTEFWETQAGEAMRALIWSLYNQHYTVQLWRALSDIQMGERSELVNLILMAQEARERVLRGLLEESGEMDRIDKHPTREDVRIDEMLREAREAAAPELRKIAERLTVWDKKWPKFSDHTGASEKEMNSICQDAAAVLAGKAGGEL